MVLELGGEAVVSACVEGVDAKSEEEEETSVGC